ATPFGSEVAQVRSPGSLHNRWCCDPELKPPIIVMGLLLTEHVVIFGVEKIILYRYPIQLIKWISEALNENKFSTWFRNFYLHGLF
ncbi:hypothetical protein, partial [Xanthomonas oryzae]|uniref:hypothetical protein n=1 Tax=Xanthomonas oryzae TaxID=347 RepID=UPI001C4AEDE1